MLARHSRSPIIRCPMRKQTMRRFKKPPFLTYVAMCGLRKVLRSFIHPDNPSFVAVLVVPEKGVIANYYEAASLLFKEESLEEFGLDDGGFTAYHVDDAKEQDRTKSLTHVTLSRRSVVLLSAPCALPDKVSMAADVVDALPPPVPAHFLDAARRHGITEMTSDDALFLSEVHFRDIAAALTLGRPYRSAMRRLRAGMRDRKVEAAVPKAEPTPTPLEDLVGFDEVREWGLSLGRDIALWKDGKLPWSEVDRGALICGPPGTGKTMLASALADACGLNFVPTSAAKWQAHGHLGDYLKAMRAAFAQATLKAPSLLFIDEVDSIGDRDSDKSDNAGYTRQAVNGVLEAMDGADRLEGVVLLGATNNARVLDPAILRPGRLERVFDIGLPDARQRAAILAQHLRPYDIDLPHTVFDKASVGMSGAELEMVARNAKRRARNAGRPLSAEDVLSSLPSTRALGDDEMRRVCVHEVGHALVGLHTMPDRLVGIFVNDVVVMGRPLQSIGRTMFERRHMTQKLASDYVGEIAMLMGGVAAEDVVFGVHSDGAGGSEGSDLTLATDLATRIECMWGLGSTFVSELAADSANLKALRMRDPEVWRRVEQIVHGQFDRARSILVGHRAALDAMVDELIVRRAMSGEAVMEIIAGASVARHA